MFRKKKDIPPTLEELEAYRVKSYKELIAPGILSYRKSPEY